VTAALWLDAAPAIQDHGAAADVTYPLRLVPVTWPQTEQSRLPARLRSAGSSHRRSGHRARKYGAVPGVA
jgi:hypothetical protein